MSGSSGGMSGSSGGMGGAPGWPQDPDQVLNESMGDFDGTIAGEREVLAKSGGSTKSADRREQGDSESVKDAGRGQGPGGMADAPGGESASGGSAGSAGAAGGAAGEQSGSQSAGAEGSQAGGGEGSENAQRSGRDSNASDRDGANVANIPDDIPIDGSGDDQVAEQIREAAMQEEDPAIRDALWEEYRKHTGIR